MDKHDTLLIACNTAEKRKILRDILRDYYYLLEANSTRQMDALLNQNRSIVAAVLVDMDIWESADIAGMECTPVIVIVKDDSQALRQRAFDMGAADVIPVDYDTDSILRRIDTIVQLHQHRQHLHQLVNEQAKVLKRSNELMVDALSSIIEYRSSESGQHVLRIRNFTKILLREVQRCCPEYQLTEETISIIASASALHDVGKISIPDSILMKSGKLTPEEWEVMKSHSIMGCHILDSMAGVGNPEYLRYAHNICHYHHERWDGSGYPEGLSGDDIPICAQVVGLADAFDALTSKRVYKDAYSLETAVNMLLNGECGAFSEKLLECFKHVAEQYKELAKAYADGMTPSTEGFDVSLPSHTDREHADSMQALQSKYISLLHYINCFVLEISVDQGHYHLRYNPYPELALIGESRDLNQLGKIILDRIVYPTDKRRMQELLETGISNFLNAGLRQQSFQFLFYGKDGQPEKYDVTLLRSNVKQTENRGFGVLCRKTDVTAETFRNQPGNPEATLMESSFVCRNDQNLTLVRYGAYTRLLAGYSLKDIQNRLNNSLLQMVHPEDRENLLRELREKFRERNVATTQYRVIARDGSIWWIISRNHLSMGEDGNEYIHSLVLDNTEAHQAYEDIQDKIRRYEIILSQTENVLFEWDVVQDTIVFSDTWKSLFGLPPVRSDVHRHLINGTFFHPDDLPLMEEAVARLYNGSRYEMAEVRIATSKGRYLWCRFRATALLDESGKLQKICGIIINVHAEKQSSQALQERAERDSLTKLLNKSAAKKYVEEYINRQDETINCALLVIDLDNFKQVNDRYGHLFGDTALKQTARILKKMFRNQDIIARVGGDEFMVLMLGTSDEELLKNRCKQLLNAFDETFRNLCQDTKLSCSVGIAVAPNHGRSFYELFRNADQAMYQAKTKGKNTFAFYDAKAVNTYSHLRNMSDIDSDREPGLAENSLVQHAFQRLYTSADVDAAINEILELVGRKMNVSRVYIFENSDDDTYCTNTHEWCNDGIQPEFQNLQRISYIDDIAGYTELYDENGIFYCPDVEMLPKNIYKMVEPQGIKSLLHCAILDEGQFRGFIGFDECVNQRIWTKEQIDVLMFLTETLSVFLMKKRQQQRVVQQAQEISSILDNQNAWICIVDPETWELKYLNAKLRNAIPEAKLGVPCYKALKGRQTPCEGCPCREILNKKSDSTMLYNEQVNISTHTEASLVQWGGKQACLMVSRSQSRDAI